MEQTFDVLRDFLGIGDLVVFQDNSVGYVMKQGDRYNDYDDGWVETYLIRLPQKKGMFKENWYNITKETFKTLEIHKRRKI